MSNKEEQSKAYIKPTILDRNKNLNDNNWELGLDYLDFTGYEVQCAFEDGWDAAIENLWHENSEEPKIDSLVLVREGDTVYAARYVGLGGFNVSSDYREFSNYKWAYISDFLPYKYE